MAQAKACPCCGEVTGGELPAHVRARAGLGPEAHARAADLVIGRHVPVYRPALLFCGLAGITVSAGWMAGIRRRAAALAEAGGFADRVRELLRSAPAVRADETPARTAGGLRCLRLACTACLALMHAGDRPAEAIGAGGVLPGCAGIIVRDGRGGCSRLTDALHAWCGARLLRDLKDLCGFEPGKQDRAQGMAALPAGARDAARDARQDGRTALDPGTPDSLTARCRRLAPAGLAANLCRRTATAKDARRIARRLLNSQDMILRFATRPDLHIFTDNQAGRTIRPVKVRQRGPGGCWRTIEGLADFAITWSCLPTAATWGTGKPGALRDLFNGHAWIPPALEPAA